MPIVFVASANASFITGQIIAGEWRQKPLRKTSRRLCGIREDDSDDQGSALRPFAVNMADRVSAFDGRAVHPRAVARVCWCRRAWSVIRFWTSAAPALTYGLYAEEVASHPCDDGGASSPSIRLPSLSC